MSLIDLREWATQYGNKTEEQKDEDEDNNPQSAGTGNNPPPEKPKLKYEQLIKEMFTNIKPDDILDWLEETLKNEPEWRSAAAKNKNKLFTIAIALITLKGRYFRDFHEWWQAYKTPPDEKTFEFKGGVKWVNMFLPDKKLDVEKTQVPITFTLTDNVAGDITDEMAIDLMKHDIGDVKATQKNVLLATKDEKLKLALQEANTWESGDFPKRLDGFRAATKKENYGQSIAATLETFEDDAISEMAAIFFGLASFLVLAWKYYSTESPDEKKENFPLKISQIHVTQRTSTKEGRTGWDYVYHAAYPPDSVEVIETMENTVSREKEHQTELKQKILRIIDYNLKKYMSDPTNYKPSELTVAGVFPQARREKQVLVVFYRAEIPLLNYILRTFGNWNTEAKNLESPPSKSTPGPAGSA